jgi:hypothetical protein
LAYLKQANLKRMPAGAYLIAIDQHWALDA